MVAQISQNYWKSGQCATWCFFWSPDDIHFTIESKQSFIWKYVQMCFKYGINVPTNYHESIQKIVAVANTKTLNQSISQWYILHNLYVNERIDYPCFTCLMYVKNGANITQDYYVGVEQLTKHSKEYFGEKDFSDMVRIWTYLDSKYLGSIIFSLESDAFFSKLETYNWNGERNKIDNSDLAFLNATRLNSYIRDLTILMFEFGARKFSFDDLIQVYDEKRNSKYFGDTYLLINDEVLFYEDIYDLLPEEHKYKPFEEIELDLDAANYNVYMKNRIS